MSARGSDGFVRPDHSARPAAVPRQWIGTPDSRWNPTLTLMLLVVALFPPAASVTPAKPEPSLVTVPEIVYVGAGVAPRAAAMLTRPVPMPPAAIESVLVRMMSLTCVCERPGLYSQMRAAIPATMGQANDVPST